MKYWLVHWHQTNPAFPVWTVCEVTDDGSVPRMIEHYSDGRTDCLSAAEEGAPSMVHGDFYDPDVDPTDPEFTTLEISADEFARRWTQAL